MKKISVVINTYNARKHLAEVLETVKGFDEIVVCDMESTDDTVEIAEKYGCKVVTFPKGTHTIVEPARNFAIQSATSEWVLVVDADELVSVNLHDYLYEFIEQSSKAKGLFIPRKNYTMNVCLPSSYPDYQLRFFVRDGTNWPAIIHANPVIPGPVEYIPRHRRDLALDHLDDSTYATIVRLNNYTENEVEKRQGERVTLLKLIFSPTWRFLKQYIIKGGFRFGIAGYVQAYRAAYYKFTALCKLYEKQIHMR